MVMAKQRLKNIIKTIVTGANMTTEAREKALPGYKGLADAQREQTALTQNAISQNEIVILLLDRLCTLKENQHDNDSSWREKWLEEKRSGNKKTLAQILIGCIAVYLGVIELNKENAIVSGFIDGTTSLLGFFL